MARVRLLVPLVLPTAPALLVACSSVWGFDQLVVGDGGAGDDAVDGTGTTGEGGQDAAGGDSTTDSPAPGTWSIVEVSFSTSTPPTCGSNWAGTSWVAYDTLTAAPATCGCTCGAPTGLVCTNQVGLQGVSGGVCTGSCTPSSPVTSGQCTVSFGVHPGMECGCCLGRREPDECRHMLAATNADGAPNVMGRPGTCVRPNEGVLRRGMPHARSDLRRLRGAERRRVVPGRPPDQARRVQRSDRHTRLLRLHLRRIDCLVRRRRHHLLQRRRVHVGDHDGDVPGQRMPVRALHVPANGSCPPSTVSPTGSATGKGPTTFCCK